MSKRIPSMVLLAWYARLAAYKAFFAKPDLGLLAEFGALFHNPAGGIEDVAMFARKGLRWMALDIREASWTVIRGAAIRAAVAVWPWQRCYDRNDIFQTFAIASFWGSTTVGINLEYTADGKTTATPQDVLDALNAFEKSSREKWTCVVITSPWMENDIAWRQLGARCVFLLEAFTNETDSTGRQWVPAELMSHAASLGARTIAAMAGIYPAKCPYPVSLVEWRHFVPNAVPILYLGDNLGANEAAWARWNPLEGG